MITIKRKDWDNPSIKNAILATAELLGEDIEIVYPKPKFKPFNVQLWRDDNILEEKDFSNKKQALKWLKTRLFLKKNKGAYADLKKYNKSNDDFDWWFYKIVDGRLEEVNNL